MKRSTRAFLASGTLTLAAALVWAACETPLPPDYQLTDARVLAIQSNPVDLVPDGSVSLQVLLYLPPGAPAPTYQWSWCAAVNGTLQCSVDAGQLTQILDQDASLGVNIDYSLGSGAQAVLAYPVNPSILQSLCERAIPDAGDAEAGNAEAGDEAGEPALDDAGLSADGEAPAFRIGGLACNGTSWTIYVLVTVGVGDARLQAVRSLTAYLTPPASTNTNPAILGLRPFTTSPPVTDAGPLADPGEQADGSLAEPAVGTDDDAGLGMAAEIPVAATDLYGVTSFGANQPDASDAGLPPCPSLVGDASPGVGFDGGCVPQVNESLTLSWYVQSGLLEHATTAMPSVRLGRPQDWNALLVNRWVPPSSAGSSEFVLVARDNRGGVGWLKLPVQLPLKPGAP